jgi:adenine-specific DNA-methyltransferase
MAYVESATFPNGWLNFELSVLRRLQFSSVALPFTGEPSVCAHLKRWRVRVAANDPMLWAYTKALALIENDSERLNDDEIEAIVDDAYVPRERLDNPSLQNWFNETDAWWFDNVRFNAERLDTPYKRAVALTLGMMVGDYVLSFAEDTRHLREPLSLSRVFRQFAETIAFPYDNSLRSKATNQEVRAFVAERRHTDLLFLRLPVPIQPQAAQSSPFAWREEWLQGGDDFWAEFEKARAGKLGSRVQSKQQYLGLVEDLLHTASHLPAWAIAHTENGFISTDELVEAVSRVRKVDAVYSKDFSDLLGVRAAIVTAQG